MIRTVASYLADERYDGLGRAGAAGEWRAAGKSNERGCSAREPAEGGVDAAD
ncbi:hypothetical protein L3Q65_36015 [Amycolatopsis sp. FU40]|uniref:hypothetical protein n=1 Tax=Amycolatopsis sp. FU40 TaxID=2914159 RepID=UPI001F490173|nr:hypothetical protein [Amycolatopsis sp. FU40]UKD53266.1 hypothetical protein L3Q65_36015 [Amycolatopsis sp. FU40]